MAFVMLLALGKGERLVFACRLENIIASTVHNSHVARTAADGAPPLQRSLKENLHAESLMPYHLPHRSVCPL